MTRDVSADDWELVPIRADVRVRGHTYAPDVIERCYALWAFRCARNCRAVARMYAAEAPDGEPVPVFSTIHKWALADNWEQRRRDDFARNHGESLYDMQLDALANMRLHLDTIADAQAGAFDDNPAAGIVRLKAGELAGKLVDRGILPLAPKPQVPETIDEDKPRDQREAEALAAMKRDRGIA